MVLYWVHTQWWLGQEFVKHKRTCKNHVHTYVIPSQSSWFTVSSTFLFMVDFIRCLKFSSCTEKKKLLSSFYITQKEPKGKKLNLFITYKTCRMHKIAHWSHQFPCPCKLQSLSERIDIHESQCKVRWMKRQDNWI